MQKPHIFPPYAFRIDGCARVRTGETKTSARYLCWKMGVDGGGEAECSRETNKCIRDSHNKHSISIEPLCSFFFFLLFFIALPMPIFFHSNQTFTAFFSFSLPFLHFTCTSNFPMGSDFFLAKDNAYNVYCIKVFLCGFFVHFCDIWSTILCLSSIFFSYMKKQIVMA